MTRQEKFRKTQVVTPSYLNRYSPAKKKNRAGEKRKKRGKIFKEI